MRRQYGWTWCATVTLGVTAVLAAWPSSTETTPAVRTTPIDSATESGEVTVSLRVLPQAPAPPGDGELPVTGTGVAPELLVLLGVAVLVLGLLLVVGARRATSRRTD
jgi:hypothetical protein